MSFCNIKIIDCSNKLHLNRLEQLKKIEDEQKSQFGRYLTLNKDGCNNKNLLYFVSVKPATNKESEQLCGVAQTETRKNLVYVNYLTSRAAKDKAYKGVGTNLLNAIIEYHKDNPKLLGVSLESATDAINFYLKYGFKSNPQDKSDMFYDFPRYRKEINLKNEDKQMIKNHFLLALERNDLSTIDELVEFHSINLKEIIEFDPTKDLTDNKYSYINEFLIKHYDDDMAIDELTFRKYVEDNNVNVICAYLNNSRKYIIDYKAFINPDDIINIINNTSMRETSYLFECLYYSKYKFNKKILNTLINVKYPSKDAILFVMKSGVIITDRDQLEEIEELAETYKLKYEVYQTVYDFSSKLINN
jgi:hypothetical protein